MAIPRHSTANFAEQVESLTQQLLHAHQREIAELRATIHHLRSQLDHDVNGGRFSSEERPAAAAGGARRPGVARLLTRLPTRTEGRPPPSKWEEPSTALPSEEEEEEEEEERTRVRPTTTSAISEATVVTDDGQNRQTTGTLGSVLSVPSKMTAAWIRSLRRRRESGLHLANGLHLTRVRRDPSNVVGGAGATADAIKRLVQSSSFEFTFSALIALNAVFMAFEAQYLSYRHSYLGRHQVDAEQAMPWAEDLFFHLGLFFGALFTLEIILRIVGLRFQFVCDLWNWIDLTIVVVWLFGRMGDTIPVNPQFFRLARLVKLLRLVRLARNMQGLDSLFLLTTSLKGSASILGWTCVMLLVVMMFSALTLHQYLAEFYFGEAKYPESERREVYRYFGSFLSSIFSMFELTLANWPPVSRTLYENVGSVFVVIAIVHKLTIGFAVVGVINGVFIQETFKVAQNNDELMLRQRRRAIRKHEEKMHRLMRTLDRSGEGAIDIHTFRQMFDDPTLSAWLAAMELVPHDVDQLFTMMDDEGDGLLSREEVTRGVAKYKGVARSIDLHALMREVRHLCHCIEGLEPLPPSRKPNSDETLPDFTL